MNKRRGLPKQPEQYREKIIPCQEPDGSGKNNDYNRIKINIEVHSSWLNNLTFIKTKLYSIFSDLSRMALPKINANKLASTQIANREVTDGLHTFIITHNLDVMQRKWNKFNEVKRFNTHTMH